MPSFDVVSKVEWSEVKNALDQAQREVAQRFDFKGTNASLEQKDSSIVILANADDRVRAAYDVLQQKLVRRKVSLKHLDAKDPEKGPGGSSKMLVAVKEGIEKDKARELVKLVKDSKIKVQAAIVEDSLRISGKKRDDLQEAIALLREKEQDIELQFVNFRD
ncbi:MAG: YajQ family cyclic di-GMP-binding protein [Polyangiaceae bacterium]